MSNFQNLQSRHICSLSAGDFDAFRKIIINISKNTGLKIIEINNSRLVQPIRKGNSILWVDFYKLVHGQYSFAFMHEGNLERKLEYIIGNQPVKIVIDELKGVIVFDNDRYECEFPSFENTKKDITTIPPLSYSGKTIVINDLKRIRSKMNGKRQVDLIIENDEFVEAILPNEVKLKFDASIINRKEVNSRNRLRSKSFLIIDGYEAYIKLAKENQNYWLITQTVVGEDMELYIFECFKPKVIPINRR